MYSTDRLKHNLIAFYPLTDNPEDIGVNALHGNFGNPKSMKGFKGALNIHKPEVLKTYDGNALRFRKGSPPICLPFDLKSPLNSSFTFSCWVYIEQPPSFIYGQIGCNLFVDKNLSIVYGVNYIDKNGTCAQYQFQSKDYLSMLDWIHLAVVYDNDNKIFKIYKDGELIPNIATNEIKNKIANSEIPLSSYNNVCLGAMDGLFGAINGCLHDFAFFSCSTSNEEIEVLACLEPPESAHAKRIAPLFVAAGIGVIAALVGTAAASSALPPREPQFAVEGNKLRNGNPVCYLYCITSEADLNSVANRVCANINTQIGVPYTANKVRKTNKSIEEVFDNLNDNDVVAIVAHGHKSGQSIGPETSKGGDEYNPDQLVSKLEELVQKNPPTKKIKVCILACYTQSFAASCNTNPANTHFVFEGQDDEYSFSDQWVPK